MAFRLKFTTLRRVSPFFGHTLKVILNLAIFSSLYLLLTSTSIADWTRIRKVSESNYSKFAPRSPPISTLLPVSNGYGKLDNDQSGTKSEPDLMTLESGYKLSPSSEKNSSFICRLVNASQLTHKRISIVRLVGPSLPPLQAPNQQSLNLEFILENELELQRASSCISQLWIVTCMYNDTEKDLILDILRSHGQTFSQFPHCSTSKRTLFNQIIDVNEVRNFAISQALKTDSDWILPLDGNIFLPANALENIVRSLIIDDRLNHMIHTIPLYRVLKCQYHFFHDDFNLFREFSLSNMQLYSKFPVLSDVLSSKQEGQIALSSKLPNLTSFFPSDEKYSKRSKLGLIERLNTGSNSKLRCGCAAGHELKHKLHEQMQVHAQLCGYAIRLSYWPDSVTCPLGDERLLPEVFLNNTALKLKADLWKKEPEVNRDIRGSLRVKAVSVLKKMLTPRRKQHSPKSDALNSNHTNP